MSAVAPPEQPLPPPNTAAPVPAPVPEIKDEPTAQGTPSAAGDATPPPIVKGAFIEAKHPRLRRWKKGKVLEVHDNGEITFFFIGKPKVVYRFEPKKCRPFITAKKEEPKPVVVSEVIDLTQVDEPPKPVDVVNLVDEEPNQTRDHFVPHPSFGDWQPYDPYEEQSYYQDRRRNDYAPPPHRPFFHTRKPGRAASSSAAPTAPCRPKPETEEERRARYIKLDAVMNGNTTSYIEEIKKKQAAAREKAKAARIAWLTDRRKNPRRTPHMSVAGAGSRDQWRKEKERRQKELEEKNRRRAEEREKRGGSTDTESESDSEIDEVNQKRVVDKKRSARKRTASVQAPRQPSTKRTERSVSEIQEQPLRELKNIVEARSKANKRREEAVREVKSIKEVITVDSESDDDDDDDSDGSDLPIVMPQPPKRKERWVPPRRATARPLVRDRTPPPVVIKGISLQKAQRIFQEKVRERLAELDIDEKELTVESSSEDEQPTRGRRSKRYNMRNRKKTKKPIVLKEETRDWWRIHLDVWAGDLLRAHDGRMADPAPKAPILKVVQPTGCGRRKQTPIYHAGARFIAMANRIDLELVKKMQKAKESVANASLSPISTFSACPCNGVGGSDGVFQPWITHQCAHCGGAIHAWCAGFHQRQKQVVCLGCAQGHNLQGKAAVPTLIDPRIHEARARVPHKRDELRLIAQKRADKVRAIVARKEHLADPSVVGAMRQNIDDLREGFAPRKSNFPVVDRLLFMMENNLL